MGERPGLSGCPSGNQVDLGSSRDSAIGSSVAENYGVDQHHRQMSGRGATAMTVAVGLACLGGTATALETLSAVHALTRGYSAGFVDLYVVRPRGWLRGYYWSAAIADPSAAILLIGGAMLVIARRRSGRIILTTGCALVIVLGIFGSVVKPDLFGAGPAGTVDRVIYLALLGFPIATIALVWTPPTTCWCPPLPARE